MIARFSHIFIACIVSTLIGCESVKGLGYDLTALDAEMRMFYKAEHDGVKDDYSQYINPILAKRSTEIYADYVAAIGRRRSLLGPPEYQCCKFRPIARESDVGRLIWIRCIVTRRSSKYWESYVASVVSAEHQAKFKYKHRLYLEQIGEVSRKPLGGIPWPKYEGIGECDI